MSEVRWTAYALWLTVAAAAAKSLQLWLSLLTTWWYIRRITYISVPGSSSPDSVDGWMSACRWCWWLRILGGMKRASVRFHHAIQDGMQFKTCDFFIFDIFHIIFSDHGWPRITETWIREGISGPILQQARSGWLLRIYTNKVFLWTGRKSWSRFVFHVEIKLVSAFWKIHWVYHKHTLNYTILCTDNELRVVCLHRKCYILLFTENELANW